MCLEAFHDGGCHSHWMAVNKARNLTFLGHRDNSGLFKQMGTSEWSSQRLKISVNTSASWSAQVPRIWSFNSSFKFSLRPWMKIMSRGRSQQPLSKAEPTNLSDGPKKERTRMQIHWEILKKTQNPDVDGTDIMQNWLVGTQLVMISGSYTKW